MAHLDFGSFQDIIDALMPDRHKYPHIQDFIKDIFIFEEFVSTLKKAKTNIENNETEKAKQDLKDAEGYLATIRKLLQDALEKQIALDPNQLDIPDV